MGLGCGHLRGDRGLVVLGQSKPGSGIGLWPKTSSRSLLGACVMSPPPVVPEPWEVTGEAGP